MLPNFQKGRRDGNCIYGSGAQERKCKLQIKTGENFHTEMVLGAEGVVREGQDGAFLWTGRGRTAEEASSPGLGRGG